VSWSPDGRFLVSGSWNTNLTIWDVESRQPKIAPIQEYCGWVISVSWSPDGRFLAWGDSRVNILDTTTWQRLGEPLRGYTSGFHLVSWNPNDGHLLASSENHDDTIIIWDAEKREELGEPLRVHQQSGNVFRRFSWSHDGNYIASCGDDETIIIWDFETRKPLLRFPLDSSANSVEWDPSGSNRLAIGQANGWVRIFQFHPARRQSFHEMRLF